MEKKRTSSGRYFLLGAAAAVSFGDVIEKNFPRRDPAQDGTRLRGDWQKIGGDLRTVIDREVSGR